MHEYFLAHIPSPMSLQSWSCFGRGGHTAYQWTTEIGVFIVGVLELDDVLSIALVHIIPHCYKGAVTASMTFISQILIEFHEGSNGTLAKWYNSQQVAKWIMVNTKWLSNRIHPAVPDYPSPQSAFNPPPPLHPDRIMHLLLDLYD